MKRLIILAGLILAAGYARADFGSDGANIFNSDSKQVAITTYTVTQIMTTDSYIQRSYLINPSTWTSVCISSYSATVVYSTTTAPSIPPNTIFSPDGPNVPWWGPLWAIVCNGPGQTAAVSQTISVLRTK